MVEAKPPHNPEDAQKNKKHKCAKKIEILQNAEKSDGTGRTSPQS